MATNLLRGNIMLQHSARACKILLLYKKIAYFLAKAAADMIKFL